MTKIGKKEQLILNRIARKKMSLAKEITTPEEHEEIKEQAKAIVKEREIGRLETRVGKPLIYSTPQEMANIMEQYIIEQNEANKPLTLGGLALRLGIGVETLRDYSKKDEYAGLIRFFKDTILAGLEERLFTSPKLFNSIRYYLNNNYSKLYADRSVVDTNHTGSISLVELNRKAMQLQDCEIIDAEEDTPEAISPQEEAQA